MAPPSQKSDVPGVEWPPIRLGRNAILSAALAELEQSQWLSPEALEAAQARQLRLVIEHHAAQSPFFARRLKESGADVGGIDGIRWLDNLPLMSRRDLQSAGTDFLAREVPAAHQPVGATKTSGSTGEPVVTRKTAANNIFWSAFTIRDHLWNGRNLTGRMTSIRPTIPAYADLPDWGRPVRDIYGSGPAQAIPITTDIRVQAELIGRFAPNILLVYPSNLSALLDLWREAGGAPGSLRHIKSIGETVSDDLRDRVRRTAGLPVEDVYSSQEMGTIAIQCPGSGLYHCMAESVIVEVLGADGTTCRDGEVGRVVVTDLHNFASPMIRYVLGDFAEKGGACPCGRGLPTLRRILGRERNLIVRADGSRHWPLVGFARFGDVAPVRQYQFIQHSVERIEFRVVTDLPLTRTEISGLRRIAQEALGAEFAIEVVEFRERLPVPASGKFEEFVCRIA